MKFQQALKQCKKVGCAHATGPGLSAMYAQLVSQMHGGDAVKYFEHFRGDDAAITESARTLLRSRKKAWDVLMGLATNNFPRS